MSGRTTDYRAVGIGAAVTSVLLAGTLVTVGSTSDLFLGVSILGGIITGVVTPRYGSALKNGFFAATLAGVVVALGVGAYGIWLSVSMGFGLDSLVSFLFTANALIGAAVLLPLFAVEGMFGASVGNWFRNKWPG